VLEVVRLVHTLCDQSRELLFDDCLLWVFVTARCAHVFMICHLVQMFVLNRDTFLDRLFSKEDISMFGVFSSSMVLLLTALAPYNQKISVQWAFAENQDENDGKGPKKPAPTPR
jgi:hypothetical protein